MSSPGFFSRQVARFKNVGKMSFQSLRNVGKRFFTSVKNAGKNFLNLFRREKVTRERTVMSILPEPFSQAEIGQKIKIAESKFRREVARQVRKEASIARGKQTTAFKEAQKRIKTRIISL